jgi:hypothetical protein
MGLLGDKRQVYAVGRRALRNSIETFFALNFRLFLVFIGQLPRCIVARSRREQRRE